MIKFKNKKVMPFLIAIVSGKNSREI